MRVRVRERARAKKKITSLSRVLLLSSHSSLGLNFVYLSPVLSERLQPPPLAWRVFNPKKVIVFVSLYSGVFEISDTWLVKDRSLRLATR